MVSSASVGSPPNTPGLFSSGVMLSSSGVPSMPSIISSFSIVNATSPESVAIVPLTGWDRYTMNPSSSSAVVSPWTSRVTGFDTSPISNVTEPDNGSVTKSSAETVGAWLVSTTHVTVEGAFRSPVRVTVKVNCVGESAPVLPSGLLASSSVLVIDSTGRSSSSIVPSALPLAVSIVALSAVVSTTLNISSGSAIVSPTTWTVIVFVASSSAANITCPLVVPSTKSTGSTGASRPTCWTSQSTVVSLLRLPSRVTVKVKFVAGSAPVSPSACTAASASTHTTGGATSSLSTVAVASPPKMMVPSGRSTLLSLSENCSSSSTSVSPLISTVTIASVIVGAKLTVPETSWPSAKSSGVKAPSSTAPNPSSTQCTSSAASVMPLRVTAKSNVVGSSPGLPSGCDSSGGATETNWLIGGAASSSLLMVPVALLSPGSSVPTDGSDRVTVNVSSASRSVSPVTARTSSTKLALAGISTSPFIPVEKSSPSAESAVLGLSSQDTFTASVVSPVRLTMNAKSVVSVSPSSCSCAAMDITTGSGASSFRIVPVASDALIVAFVGADSVTVNPSLGSSSVSPWT